MVLSVLGMLAWIGLSQLGLWQETALIGAFRENVGVSRQKPSEMKLHLVFSTGCSAFQDWQSFVFFYQVLRSGQEGDVTRVASGCTDATAEALRTIFREQILSLPGGADRFHLHLTPDYSLAAGGDEEYKFFNKPFGLRHWMEHGLGFPDSLPQFQSTVLVILDPDEILLRPFRADFTHDNAAVWHEPPGGASRFVVQEGRPFAQLYNFGINGLWMRIVNNGVGQIIDSASKPSSAPQQSTTNGTPPASSHLYSCTESEILQSYAAGPPYIGVALDMYNIVKTWSAFAVPVYKLFGGTHLSEMFAYVIAAAHLNLPHQLSKSFMVSNPEMHQVEGFEVIDGAIPEQICRYARNDDKMADAGVAWTSSLPQVIHYCQRYVLGPYTFSKYLLPEDFLSCKQPLLRDPLEYEGTRFVTMYNSSMTFKNEVVELSLMEAKRHAFILCHVISKLNEAATYWKEQHCTAEDDHANYSKELIFPKDAPMPSD